MCPAHGQYAVRIGTGTEWQRAPDGRRSCNVRVASAPRQRAMVIGIGKFDPPATATEPGPDAPAGFALLQFAEERVAEVAEALQALGLHLVGGQVQLDPELDELQELLGEAAGDDRPLVAHVLSHGSLGEGWTSPLRQDTSLERRMSVWQTRSTGDDGSSLRSSSMTRWTWSAAPAGRSPRSPTSLGSTTPRWATGSARTASTVARPRG